MTKVLPLPDAQKKGYYPEEWDKAKGYDARYEDRNKKNLAKAKGGVRVVGLSQADHCLFLSNEADVLHEMRVFLATLP